MREQLYEDGGLPDYVRILLDDSDDDELAERVASGVRDAEDGSVGPMK